MKPVKNTTKTVCSLCAPELFKKYCMLFKDGSGSVFRGEYGGLEWTFSHCPSCPGIGTHKKVLRRVEPTVVCCTGKEGINRWQFTLEDYNETSG